MHRKVAVAIAAALALVAASCGGSETATTTLSRAALVRRVELACRAAEEASTRLSNAKRPPEALQIMRAGQRLLVTRIEGLGGSGAAKDDFDMYKDGARTRLELIEKVVAASRAERTRVLREVEDDATAAGRKLETATRHLGLVGCG